MPTVDLDVAYQQLLDEGYTVIEDVLSSETVAVLRESVDELMRAEREAPFLPPDGPDAEGDDELEKFLSDSYTVSREELERIMRRVRHSRAVNHDTSWPVAPDRVNKCFLHLPTLFDQDRSQRIWNLLTRGAEFPALAEHPLVLSLVRQLLGDDCMLSDMSATSIGAGTGGGAWHVDVPLGQLDEPLPDFPLTTQNAWMLDDFTPDNGATRIVPGSHRSRKKPRWAEGELPDGKPLCAPAGSVAIWLSNTWHRSGPNSTDRPRRAILCYYCRSWVQPFSDLTHSVTAEEAGSYSPTVRYLMGFGSRPPMRS